MTSDRIIDKQLSLHIFIEGSSLKLGIKKLETIHFLYKAKNTAKRIELKQGASFLYWGSGRLNQSSIFDRNFISYIAFHIKYVMQE